MLLCNSDVVLSLSKIGLKQPYWTCMLQYRVFFIWFLTFAVPDYFTVHYHEYCYAPQYHGHVISCENSADLTVCICAFQERYVASLMPLQKSISPWKSPPQLRAFISQDFMKTLEKAGPQLTSRLKGDWIGLYRCARVQSLQLKTALFFIMYCFKVHHTQVYIYTVKSFKL